MLNISFENNDLNGNEAIAILINDQLKLDKDIIALDRQHHGIISKTIEDKRKFKGKFGDTAVVTTINKAGNTGYLIIICSGNESKLKSVQLEQIGGKIYKQAAHLKATTLGIRLSDKIGSFEQEEASALIASGALLASYKFDKYHTKKSEQEKEDEQNIIKEFNIIVSDEESTLKHFEHYKAIAMGVFFARDCVSEAPNVLYPETYAEKIVQQLEPLGIDIDVLGEREMRNLGMMAMIGVGQGSINESKIVVMKYEGGGDDQDPVCFVGKGVTFDTGGISLKPPGGMADMKYDMAGSAAVVGAMKALALRSAKVNAVGIVGLVENMPGGNAQRPGDVVTTMSGQTVEILNTDAEGRLVLCDCITYLQKNFKPECVVDLATLTGAILIALANSYAGCFANDDELADKLIKAGNETKEKLWRMPLCQDFDKMLKSPIADIANIGGERGMAGSSTAAHFIGRFIEEGVKWAHLDIAGMAWDKKGQNPICPQGAVGFGVRLLDKFVQDNYETE